MFKPVDTILFATNLSDNCSQAFDFAATIAVRFQATIIILHVIEKSPDYVEGRIRRLLGKEQWEQMQRSKEHDAKKILIGKKSVNKMIKEALSVYCDQVGIEDESCGYHSREIVISDGDVVDDILKNAQKYKCDLIIMGTQRGFLSNNTIGPTIKSVMRRSKRAVMVVPPFEGQ